MKRVVDLVKPLESIVSPSIIKKASVEFLKQLNVGGNEGSKFFSRLELKNSGVTSNFILKEYDPSMFFSKQYLEKLLHNRVMANIFLRKKGYPVAQTVRYFFDPSSNNYYMLMSDVTKGGKYRIWGYSNNMEVAQLYELHNMKLEASDIQLIYNLIQNLSQRATGDKIRFNYYNYHILQDIQTRELFICLLDLDEIQVVNDVFRDIREIRKLNDAGVREFKVRFSDARQ